MPSGKSKAEYLKVSNSRSTFENFIVISDSDGRRNKPNSFRSEPTQHFSAKEINERSCCFCFDLPVTFSVSPLSFSPPSLSTPHGPTSTLSSHRCVQKHTSTARLLWRRREDEPLPLSLCSRDYMAYRAQ